MKCDYHPEYDAVSTCSKCGRPICKVCEYFKEPNPVCLTCYEKHVSSLPKADYSKRTSDVNKKTIVIPGLVVLGTGLFSWGTAISCSGLMIVGVILLAVSILGLGLWK